MFSKILLVLIAGWFFLILIRIIKLYREYKVFYGQKKLVVLMSNQDEAAEGFLRRLIAWRNKFWPWLEITIVDCGSSDLTGRIIYLLAREMGFTAVSKEELFYRKEKVQIYYYDVCGQRGRNLLAIPLPCLV